MTKELKMKANDIRKDIVSMIAQAGSGHPGGSLSCADIMTALYFGGVLNYDASNPRKEDRDRFVTCPCGLFSARGVENASQTGKSLARAS